MNYNNELKEIDTEQKAYFLGFMYADGCISLIKRKNSSYVKPQVRISLTDEQIIKDFHNYFPFFNLQIFDFGKYKESWSKQFSLNKVNKQLFDDLLNHGMLERKSIDNYDNLKLPSLNPELIPHFIRGLFDGDGSINISAKRPNLRRIEICSASKEFLLQIRNVLESLNINCPIFRKKNNNPSPLYVLEWVNSKDILLLKDFFYNNATIFLNRKKEKFDSFKIVDKKEKNPLCPECFEQKTIKGGERQMKHGLMFRYTCTNCNKKFSIPAQVKQDELSGKPYKGNQQPSLGSNTFEGSTTNSRVLSSNIEDSNANKSVLLY
jgi:intein/homing endonuclease